METTGKKRIDVEELETMHRRRREIDMIPIEDIDFYKNGKKLEINPAIIRNWKYAGLGNYYFIADKMYEEQNECH